MKRIKENSNDLLFNVDVIPKPRSEVKQWDDAVFDIIDALTAPILTFSESWADTIPSRLLNLVSIERMAGIIKRHTYATDVECVIYIYTRTLEAPMPSDWTDIYTHLSCKVCERHFNENHWEEVNAPKELTDWLISQLNQLRNFIFVKRREVVKQRLRQEKVDNNNIEKLEASTATTKATVESSQISFDF